MPTRPCIERNTMAAVRSTFTKPFGLTRLISFPRSLSDIDLTTAANDPRPSASFSARKNPQRIPANTPPVFPGLRPRICPHLLRLVTMAMSDRLLASLDGRPVPPANYAQGSATPPKEVRIHKNKKGTGRLQACPHNASPGLVSCYTTVHCEGH